MRRDEEPYLVVGALERVRRFEGDGSLAVGAGDVYDRYVGLNVIFRTCRTFLHDAEQLK